VTLPPHAPLEDDAPHTLLDCWRGCTLTPQIIRATLAKSAKGAQELFETLNRSALGIDLSLRLDSQDVGSGTPLPSRHPDAAPGTDEGGTTSGGSRRAADLFGLSSERGYARAVLPTGAGPGSEEPAILPAPTTGVAPGIGAPSDVTTVGVRQGRASVACQAHNLEEEGSTPSPATHTKREEATGLAQTGAAADETDCGSLLPDDVCVACGADCWCRRCGAPCSVGCDCLDRRDDGGEP
jgi:hypothetical protein